MIMVIIGCFAVCWFPFAIMFVLLPTSESAAEFFLEKNLEILEIIVWIGKKNKYLIVLLTLYIFQDM